jgi:hypothetical protein
MRKRPTPSAAEHSGDRDGHPASISTAPRGIAVAPALALSG